MFLALLYGQFLYFPEDKTTYIPAVLQMIMLLIVVVIVFRLFIKKSNRDAQAARELEQRLVQERQKQIEK